MKHLTLLVSLAFIGCSGYEPEQANTADESLDRAAVPELMNEKYQSSDSVAFKSFGRTTTPSMQGITLAGRGGDGDIGGDKKPNIDRKIITNAEVFLILEDLDAGEKQLKELITQNGGLIASSDLRGTSGSQRAGHWKIRIPVANFDAFKAKVEKIGNLERSSTHSSDVTEEFYDVEARLKNKKIEETRLIQHLEKSTAKLSDILEVEKELSRVRGEVEQMQGRINMLNNLTSLTTIDVSLREVKNYVPPTAASFGDDVNRTLNSSWSGLVTTGRKFTLSLISLLPWVPFLAILGYLVYLLLRRLIIKSKPATISA